MPYWTPDGVYVDEFGNPTIPTPDAFDALGQSQHNPQDYAPMGTNPLPPTEEQSAERYGAYMQAHGLVGREPEQFTITPPAPLGSGDKVAGGGGSVATSQSGFDGGKYDQVDKTTKRPGGLEGQMADEYDRAQALADQQAGAVTQAAQGEAVAKEQTAQIQARQAQAQAAGNVALSELQGRFAAGEEAASATASAVAAQARGRYVAQVQQYAAMEVDPNKLWGSLTNGGKVGMLVSAFVTDFLGASGVKTSAMDYFNQAIQRNIDSQIENIRKQGVVAEHFRALWDMQRAESASDAEARERLRGFYLAQAQQSVLAEVNKYGSDLALAQGGEAVAAIQKELASTLVNISQMAEQNYHAAVQQRVQIWSTKVQAANAAASLKLQRDQFEYAKGKDAEAKVGKLVAETAPLVVRDTKSGKAIYKAPTKEIADELNTKAAFVRSIAEKAEKLKELEKLAGDRYGSWGEAMQHNEFAKRAEALHNDLQLTIANEKSGKTFTAGELAKYESMLPQNVWGYRGDPSVVINDLIVRTNDDFNNATKSRGAMNFQGDERVLAASGVWDGNAVNTAGDLAAGAAAANDQGNRTLNTPADDHLNASNSPDAGAKTVVKANPNFTAEDIEAAKRLGVADDNKFLGEENLADAAKNKGPTPSAVAPKWVVEIDNTADVALKGDDAMLEKAITKLSYIATGFDSKSALEAEDNLDEENKPVASAARAAWATHQLQTKLLPEYHRRQQAAQE